DPAGRETMVGDDRRTLRKGHGDVGVFEGPTVERAEVSLQRRRRPLARAEALLAADIERDLRLEPAFAMPKEARQPAEMIVVAVAKHEGVEARGIDAQKLEIAEQRPRREAEVAQQVAHLGTPPRFDMHRQAEFADDRPARRLVAERPAEALDF